jgi:hypothetical protein
MPEKVAWATAQILGGSPRSSVLAQIPADLRPEVERRVAASLSETPEENRRRLIDEARRKGEGLILGGEVVVHPRRDPAPPIVARPVER